MGQITILNGTNTVINTCISAGVNYSWCNKLSPKRYYHHDGAIGTYTLNTNYWMSESSEFSNSGAEIGLFVAGVVIGVVGLALVPFTGGASASGSAAAVAAIAATIGGAVTSAAGLAISGIAIAVEDFQNTPSKWTNIHAFENPKFIAESTVEVEKILQPDGSYLLEYRKLPEIKLRKLTEEQYQAYLASGEYTEHQSKPITGGYVTSTELDRLGLKNSKVIVRPAWGGEASWEVESDQTRVGAPVQLWVRPRERKVEWRFVPANENPDNNQFYLYNPVLERYIGGKAELDGQVSIKASVTAEDSFHLIKTEDARHNQEDDTTNKNCFVFIPSNNKKLTLIAESGNNGNSTKLKYGPITTLNPAWAMWKVIRV